MKTPEQAAEEYAEDYMFIALRKPISKAFLAGAKWQASQHPTDLGINKREAFIRGYKAALIKPSDDDSLHTPLDSKGGFSAVDSTQIKPSDGGYTKDDMKNLIDWCGGEEGFNLIDEGETTESLFNKYLQNLKTKK